MLKLDSSKARNELGWKPKLSLNQALTQIVDWHKDVARGGDARAISLLQIDEHMACGTPRTSEDQWARTIYLALRNCRLCPNSRMRLNCTILTFTSSGKLPAATTPRSPSSTA